MEGTGVTAEHPPNESTTSNTSTPGSASKRRSRSRTDSYTRRHKQRVQIAEASQTSTLVLTNIRSRSHRQLETQIRSLLEDDKIEDILLDPRHSFGFLVLSGYDILCEVKSVLENLAVDGQRILLEPCIAPTPGVNPRFIFDGKTQCNTVVIKNLPFDCVEDGLRAELKTFSSPIEPAQIEFKNGSTGQFSGMAFLTFDTFEDAMSACRELNGSTIGNRLIRVELRREGSRPLSQFAIPESVVLPSYQGDVSDMKRKLEEVAKEKRVRWNCKIPDDRVLLLLKNQAEILGLAVKVETLSLGIRQASFWKVDGPSFSRRSKARLERRRAISMCERPPSPKQRGESSKPTRDVRSKTFSHRSGRRTVSLSQTSSSSSATFAIRQPKGPEGSGFNRKRTLRS